MIKIRMLETRRGTEDSFSINLYEKDKEYIVRDHLALAFASAKKAIIINQREEA